jgi:hypothetical protein
VNQFYKNENCSFSFQEMFQTEFITLSILATTFLCSGQQLLPSAEIQKEENFGTPANIVEDNTSNDCTDYSDQVFEQNYFIHSLGLLVF